MLSLGDSGVGVYDPSGGVIYADKALRCVQDLCVQLGVVIKDGEGVEDIHHDATSVQVTTTSGARLVLCQKGRGINYFAHRCLRITSLEIQ